MSFPYTPNMHEAKLESLQTQHEFLNLLRLRHLNWMSSSEDPQIKHHHQEIAELIEKMNDQYMHLLQQLKPPSPEWEGHENNLK